MRLKDIEKQAIIEALAKTGWHVTLAAKALGIARATMYRKLIQHDIKRPSTVSLRSTPHEINT